MGLEPARAIQWSDEAELTAWPSRVVKVISVMAEDLMKERKDQKHAGYILCHDSTAGSS